MSLQRKFAADLSDSFASRDGGLLAGFNIGKPSAHFLDQLAFFFVRKPVAKVKGTQSATHRNPHTDHKP